MTAQTALRPPRNVNQNPPVAPDKKRAILRVLDFLDEGRGVTNAELKTRANVGHSEFDRGVAQLEDVGFVKSVAVSKSGRAKSAWSTSPGWKLTDAGRMWLATEPAAPPPCVALTVAPCRALRVITYDATPVFNRWSGRVRFTTPARPYEHFSIPGGARWL
jgi:hypothetical protein